VPFVANCQEVEVVEVEVGEEVEVEGVVEDHHPWEDLRPTSPNNLLNLSRMSR